MSSAWRLPAAVAALLCLGCGGSGPGLVPISGKVTLNGVPLEGATVVFVPDPSNREGLTSTSVSDAEGGYEASTEGRSGLVPGKYKVIVTKSPDDPSLKIPPEFADDPYMARTLVPPSKASRSGQPAEPRIQGQFDKEVTAAEDHLDFDLKSKGPAAARPLR
jgi:hypothetical protein